MNKTIKSITKRLTVTKNGKVVRRPMGVDHFKTRKNSKTIRRKRKTLSLNYPITRP